MMKKVLCISISLIILLLYQNDIFGFGKNKIQYEKFDFKVLKTAHFDIYYNKGQELLAKETAKILESAAADLSHRWRFELTYVFPIIIYNSHNDFEQSNVTLELISEGTGGFTEFFKSRIVVPFTGSYAAFRHVLHHELTHGFQINLLLGNSWESLLTRQFMYMPPLWFIEGAAEFYSVGWDNEVDMFMRDATVNNMLVPINRLEDLGSLRGSEYYMIYKEGQALEYYISEKYGEYVISDIFKVFQKTRDFYQSFKLVIGKTHYDVYKEWVRHMRKKYWPLVEKKKEPLEFSKKITDHLKDRSFYNLKPVWSHDGKKIAFLTDKHIYMSIIAVDSETGEELDRIVSSGTEADYEEMHSKDNALSWSKDGKYLVFISKAGAYDVINIYDIEKGKVTKRLNPKLNALASPDIAVDNSKIVFSGVKDGKSDLYIIDFDGKNLKRLMNDKYFDSYPIWDKSGKYIIFTSNRDRGYLSGDSEIFVYDLDLKNITKIISSKGYNISPKLDRKNEKLVYVSDRDGIPNLYIKLVNEFQDIESLIDENDYKITDIITAAFDPSFSPDGKKIVYSGFYKMGQDIYTMDVPEDMPDKMIAKKEMTNIELEKKEYMQETAFDLSGAKVEEQSFGLTPDWIMGGFIYSSVSGFGGFTYLGFSDILGNHRFSISSDFLSGNNDLNFHLVYAYLPYRVNYIASVFHYKDYYYYYTLDDEDIYRFKFFYLRRYGVDLTASYPFTKFLRVDVDFLNMKYTRFTPSDGTDDQPVLKNFDVNLSLAGLSLVYDTILWGLTGPVMGTRWRAIFQKSIPITGKNWLFELGFADFRKYFFINKKYTFAIRMQYGSVWGRDRLRNKFYLGGFNTIRGHRYSEYSGTKMALMNFEYRYPFINILQFGWPFTFNITNLRALFFWDFGSAFSNLQQWRMGGGSGSYKFQDLKSGLGWGLRFGLAYFRFKLDFATPWDGSKIRPLSKWQGFFSIGYDF